MFLTSNCSLRLHSAMVRILSLYYTDVIDNNHGDGSDGDDDDDDWTFNWGNIDFNLCHSGRPNKESEWVRSLFLIARGSAGICKYHLEFVASLKLFKILFVICLQFYFDICPQFSLVLVIYLILNIWYLSQISFWYLPQFNPGICSQFEANSSLPPTSFKEVRLGWLSRFRSTSLPIIFFSTPHGTKWQRQTYQNGNALLWVQECSKM